VRIAAIVPVSLAFLLAVSGLKAESDSPDATKSTAPPKTTSNADWYAGEQSPSGWYVEFYPIYGYLPIYGANITLPQLPSLPDSGGSGSTGLSRSYALESEIRIEKKKFSITGTGMWMGLSSERQTPIVKTSEDTTYGQAMLGYEVLSGLWLEGGFRHISLNIHAQLGGRPEVSTKPSLWDPLLGITYRHRLGRKWMFHGQMQGGGFGVGSQSVISGLARMDWHFAKHFGATFGFGAQHFTISEPVLQQTQLARTLEYSNTLYGPLLGLGIYF
jgi:hypothetical protein